MLQIYSSFLQKYNRMLFTPDILLDIALEFIKCPLTDVHVWPQIASGELISLNWSSIFIPEHLQLVQVFVKN